MGSFLIKAVSQMVAIYCTEYSRNTLMDTENDACDKKIGAMVALSIWAPFRSYFSGQCLTSGSILPVRLAGDRHGQICAWGWCSCTNSNWRAARRQKYRNNRISVWCTLERRCWHMKPYTSPRFYMLRMEPTMNNYLWQARFWRNWLVPPAVGMFKVQ